MLDEDDFDVKVGTLFNRILFRGVVIPIPLIFPKVPQSSLGILRTLQSLYFFRAIVFQSPSLLV